MKKIILSILLASLLLSGCASNTSNTTNDKNEKISEETKIQEKEEKKEEKNLDEQTEKEPSINIDTPQEIEETEEVEDTTVVEVKNESAETAVDETVWANTYSNLRSGPGTSYDVIGTVNRGDSLHRIAVLNNGWSKIEYNNSSAYINSNLIQTEEIKESSQVTSTQEQETSSSEATVENTSTTQNTSTLCTGTAKEIFDATNAERVAAGLEPLEWSDELARCADIRAGEIITDFSHTRPDGTKCYALSSLIAGENIIRGPHATGQEMVAQWMASEGHRANILYADYKTIGISTRCTEQGDTGCQLFGY